MQKMTLSRRAVILLVGMAAIVGGALAWANKVTREVIVKREDEEKMVLVNQLLPRDAYNNRLLRDTVKLTENETLGTRENTLIYRARIDGKPSAVLFEAVTPNGYGGRIRVIVAVRADGSLHGVRVLNHNETPGWGDYIEIAKNKWIRLFERQSLTNHSEKGWQVRKDGGDFEYVTRATVTARAMVECVHRALKFYASHKDIVFSDVPRIEE